MNSLKRLVFATNNAHKLEEARRIIGDSFEVMSLADIGCHDDIPETADTLEGNALIKARWVRDRYGYDCFSDDTGLMVDALGGAPGVHTARYAGPQCNADDNVAKLLEDMEGKENRHAHFSTVVALVADGEERCFEGRVDGKIAHSRHGNGGFGYDPVFVADESGKCFAEMEPEAKNSISHRGRAMRKLRDFLCLMAVILSAVGFASKAKAESWRILSSYDGQIERVIDTKNYTYFHGTSQQFDPTNSYLSTLYGVLIRYDKDEDEWTNLNTMNLLSGNTIQAVEYNHDKRYLAVAYNDGNLDLVYDNGTVVNIPGLMLADASLSKTVYSISIDNDNNRIYLATGFGYVAISDASKQIEYSRLLDTQVAATTRFDDKLWIVANNDIMYGDDADFNLDSFTKVGELANVVRMYPLGSRGIVVLHGRRVDLLCSLISKQEDGEWQVSNFSWAKELSLEKTPQGLSLMSYYNIRFLHDDGSDWFVNLERSDYGSQGASYNERDVWMSASRNGFYCKQVPGSDGNWTLLMDKFFPNVSNAFMCTGMAYSPEYGMLVRNHSMDQNFNTDNSNFVNTDDLISGYRNMEWTPYSTTYLLPDSKGLKFLDPRGIAIDPNNPDHAYGGSITTGLLRLDLSDVSKSLRFGKESDEQGGYGETGFVVAVDEPVDGASWAERCQFSEPAFDAYGNLWSVYVNPMPGDTDYAELWYWTAANRAATTSTSSFRPFGKIAVDGVYMSNNPKMIPLTHSSNKNIVVFHGNYHGEGMIVYNHNGTLSDTSDDKYVKLLTIYDQDGNKLTFNYAFVLFEDTSTGLVWVCTQTDIFTFDPKEIFSDSSSVRRIKVPRNDGTNLADYLLNGVQVNKIITDKSGNKWFATQGAGLMCTSSDGREILEEYTTDNSMLPSDVVYDICLDTDNNAIMVSTSMGLAMLYLSSAYSGSESNVRVYPNPARPDYHGYVTIDGLPAEALVKIVDSTGTVIKECGQATAGEVKWDLTNHGYKKVPAGVYFIIATNGPDSDSYAKVSKVAVIR